MGRAPKQSGRKRAGAQATAVSCLDAFLIIIIKPSPALKYALLIALTPPLKPWGPLQTLTALSHRDLGIGSLAEISSNDSGTVKCDFGWSSDTLVDSNPTVGANPQKILVLS